MLWGGQEQRLCSVGKTITGALGCKTWAGKSSAKGVERGWGSRVISISIALMGKSRMGGIEGRWVVRGVGERV